jgi:hypothetical protein
MRVEHVTTVIALDGSASIGDDIGSFDQLLDFLNGTRVPVEKPSTASFF